MAETAGPRPGAGPAVRPGNGAAPPANAPANSAEHPFAVRVLATKLADWIGRLGPVWVEGQLTEVNRRGSTAYLTLRDPSVDVSVSMVCSREVLAACAPEPQVGARVVAFGRMEYWERNGRLSFRAREIRHVGEGELAARIEALRLALEAEGLFRASRKRRLPVLPTAVGLITGRSSAAERDVQRIATSRWPGVRMVVRNVAVQGPKAVTEVIGALRELDRDPAVDVILVARGGGSFEDLLPFSDETLIRAVSACGTPVVSAIGHEPDTPLLDLVADVRAATPTHAAKLAVPDVAEHAWQIGQDVARVRAAVRGRLDAEQARILALAGRPVLADPRRGIDDRAAEIGRLRDRATRVVRGGLDRAAEDLDHRRARVRALSPAATLARGYAVVQRADGSVVRRAAEVPAGAAVVLRLAEGRLGAVITGEATGPVPAASPPLVATGPTPSAAGPAAADPTNTEER